MKISSSAANPRATQTLTAIVATLALAIAGVLGIAPAAQAETAFALSYSLDADGNATITGHSGTNASIIIIPSYIDSHPVIAIGQGALWGVSTADTLIVEEGVTTIGRLAFYGTSFQNFEFPTTLTTIGDGVFGLAYVHDITFIGNAPTSVSSGVFDDAVLGNARVLNLAGATGFSSTWYGVPVTTTSPFKYTTTNNEVTITGYLGTNFGNLVVPAQLGGNPVVAIGEGSLNTIGFQTLSLPDSLRSIGAVSLGGSYMSSIVIPAGVTSIGAWAFAGSPNLTSVTFKGNAPTLTGYDPFWWTNPHLTSVTVYEDATGFGDVWDNLTVVRVPRPSSDVSLSALTATNGTLNETLSASTTSYTITVAAGTSVVQLDATATDVGATVDVDGSGSASAVFFMDYGPVTTNVTVLAADGVTTATYSVSITRAAPLSNDADLGALTLSAGTVSTASLYNLTASVANSVSSITLTATPHESHGTIKVNDTAVTSGVASDAIALNVGDNTITIAVTSQAGTTTHTYNLVVTRAAAPVDNTANGKLSALGVSAGALSPTFDPTYGSYEVFVANSVSAINFTPTLQADGATVKVNGNDTASGSASSDINLSVGDNYVTILTTAPNGYTNVVYSIVVHRADPPSTESSLSRLGPTLGSLNETFDRTVTSYTMNVASGVTSVSLDHCAESAFATVKVNGSADARCGASADVTLSVGPNTVTVEVTAQDGTTKTTYTVVVTRAAPPSSDAALSAIFSSTYGQNLSPTFASATSAYSFDVANSVTSVSLVALVNEPHATYTVNGAATENGFSSAINLSVGANVITYVVTAQDGTTTKTYTVTVNRAPSSDTNLTSIALDSGTLSPTFAAGTTSYSVTVGADVASIKVTLGFDWQNHTVKINNLGIASGVASRAISLSVGSNTITVVVTAQDTVSTKTYTITVTRPAPLSNDAMLSALAPSTGSLSPSFASGTTSYAVNVPYGTTSIAFTPTVNEAHATVTVGASDTTSGVASSAVNLAVGPNTIDVQVTAQDGSKKLYIVTVTRAAASTDATLANLTFNGGTWSKVFASGATTYALTIPYTQTTLTGLATTTFNGATLKFNGLTVANASQSQLLTSSTTSVAIVVTAQDGVTTKTYNVALTWMPQPVAAKTTTAAKITGTAKVGKSLKLTQAKFTGTALGTVTTAWYLCSTKQAGGSIKPPAGCSVISGAKLGGLTLTSKMAGKFVSALQTVTNSLGTAYSFTASLGKVVK